MSQTIHRDFEAGNDPNGHRDSPQSAPNQPLQGESNFGDSSGKLFSIYSNVAEDEDNKMVERWQKDADGILIFTGLFSAAVAALLAVTVQDLRPNSQDTSAFYLGNIYGVLADPNATRASIPPPIAKPPPFSRPRYAVWVNSLWFLSLVMSLSCALWATSLHQWARRYIRLTQPARCSPENRARMRAFFANGVEKMHIPWAVEGLPTLLHLSLFLFFGGLAIFLFNVDKEVFICVVCWIGLSSMVYLLTTLLPLIRPDSPYNTPLSTPAWFLYPRIQYMVLKVPTFIVAFIIIFIWISATIIFKVLSFITSNQIQRYGEQFLDQISEYYHVTQTSNIWERHLRRWMSGSVEKKAKETAEKQLSEIDIRILTWTISALGDDDSLEKFFEALPGFFNSKLVGDLRLPYHISNGLSDALDGFVGRTLTSNSVIDKVKLHRLDISLAAMNVISIYDISSILWSVLYEHWNHMSPTVETGRTLARWCTSNYRRTALYAQGIVSRVLSTVRERDHRWVELAAPICGLSERDLLEIATRGDDSVSLAILIRATREAFRSSDSGGVDGLTQFDIRNTLSGMQHDFCTLWNEIVQEAKNQGPITTPVGILREIRHHYLALHQGTDVAPTAFSPSTVDHDPILLYPSSYPLCDIASHRADSIAQVPVPVLTQPVHSPDASPHHSTSGIDTVSQQVNEASIIPGLPLPSDPTTPSKVGDSSRSPAAGSPALAVHMSPHHTPPSAEVAAPQDISSAATLSHPLEGTTRQHTLAPVPGSTGTTPVLNRSYDPGAASTSKPLLPASSVVEFSIPDSPSPPRVLPLSNADSLALLSGTTPSRPTGNALPPRLRARGLVNTESICFANAVLQLLVHSPPFWDLLRELGDLTGQRGAGGPETGDSTTPLVDATVKFSDEFVYKEELSMTRQLQPSAAKGKARDDEEAKKEHNTVDSFNPRYMFDAMKQKRRLKDLLDGQQQDADEFFRLYLDSLDEELLGVEEREVGTSGLADVGKRDFTAKSVESDLVRIFGGKFRSTVRAPSQPDIVTIEDWRSLQLDIQHDSVHTVEDALKRISHLQPVQLGLSGTEASQQVLIEALPPVLVLHLKRFLYDAANSINKIGNPVRFAPELEIPLEIMTPVAGKSGEPMHYKLYGVLYHHGESAGSGHYTVDVLHPDGGSGNGEAWLHIDDEVVSAMRNKDVFGSCNNERADERCAYMLFYCRTAPTQT